MNGSVVAGMRQLQQTAQTPVVTLLGEAFARAGQELALVGGSVRDAFLGRAGFDLDFATNASPEQTLSLVRPLASAHWDTGMRFGTVAALVRGERVEITTYRADVYDHASRKPTVTFGTSLDDDLYRRDFTINAMALRVPGGVLVDPTNGLADVLAGVIRTPAPPAESFSDDPLRMMRAARFVAQLGFAIDEGTATAMQAMHESLSIVSAERVRDELIKLLTGQYPERGIDVLVASGLAAEMLPELPALQLETDEHHHHKDVYQHTLTVLRQAIDQEEDGPDLVLRLAALLHDVGKPATRRFESDGRVTFYNHDLVGARLARRRLKALRFDNDTIRAVSRLVELHLRFFGYSEGAWTDSAVRRYVRDAGDLLPRLHKLTRADVTTRNRRRAQWLAHAYDDIERRIGELAEQEELAAIRPDLTGDDIMRILAIPPGPLVGRAYAHLLDARLDEGPLGADEAERRLREWYAAEQAGEDENLG